MRESLTDDGETGEGESGGIMFPGIWRNLEECPEFGLGAREGDIAKIREVIKTDSKCKEALNVRTGSLKLMMEVQRRQKRHRGKWKVMLSREPWRPVTGLGSLGCLGLWERKIARERRIFNSHVPHRYINKAQ